MDDEKAGDLVDAIVQVIDMRIAVSFASRNAGPGKDRIAKADFSARSHLLDLLAND